MPRPATFAMFFAMALAARVFAQGPVEALQTPRNSQPTFYVRADVNSSSRTYRQGDILQVDVVSEADAYLYVLYVQADGQTVCLFPNRFQNDNRVRAKQPIRIPDERDIFRWRVEGPFGRERVIVLARREPLAVSDLPSLTESRFTKLTSAQAKAIQVEICEQPTPTWAADEIVITTRAKDDSVGQEARRVGVFFGVSKYAYSPQLEAVSGRGLNLPGCRRDAREMANLMREAGLLSQTLVFTDEQATRAAMEEAITRWLPANTRSGDTAFIFFSGHGGQVCDLDGDEKRREGESQPQDEFLLPYDFMPANSALFKALLADAKAGKLNDLQAEGLARAVEIAKNARKTEDIPVALAHGTGVVDDLFGQWIQQLAGRKVVVIVDACFSGGLATDEKGLSDHLDAASFDFLDGELGRLKDLGQRDLAFVASSSLRDTSAVRAERDMSVMTFELIKAIRNEPRALSLKDGYMRCKKGMADYFRANPKAKAHEPYLFDSSTETIYLRP